MSRLMVVEPPRDSPTTGMVEPGLNSGNRRANLISYVHPEWWEHFDTWFAPHCCC